MNKKTIVRVAGSILTVLAICFVIWKIISFKISIIDFFTLTNLLMLFIVPIEMAFIVFVNSWCWGKILGLFTEDSIPVGETFSIYASSNLMKYIPGNVGHFVGRQLFCEKLGISQAEMAFTSLLEFGISMLATVLCALFFSEKTVVEITKKYIANVWFYPSLFLIIVLVFLFLLLVEIKGKTQLRRVITRPQFWNAMIITCLWYIFAIIIINTPHIFLLKQYVGLNIEDCWEVLSASILSHFIGYAMPGVSGGVGVKEMVFVKMLESRFQGGYLSTVGVVQRLYLVFGEVLAFFMGSLFDERRKR